ncbi:MAG: hypothetical protein CL709_03080 [Chloroflexi bacterium]|nr:hypothetical protein [Chloroflexota bacterium]
MDHQLKMIRQQIMMQHTCIDQRPYMVEFSSMRTSSAPNFNDLLARTNWDEGFALTRQSTRH